VMSSNVARRRNEIGIRIWRWAGAEESRMLRMVLGGFDVDVSGHSHIGPDVVH
jgi:hypothetical protein